ncbi:hypothetical protein [Halobaculum roseum]|uniref:DUF4352 domain-containing protein n=1 Tax=Halobaculum roseum TaxID=2175149 RepID=A0ABD5MXK4_9EURY|nr:hypothetical protein [Halobaculum roseum]QZY04604.1 hypothetical protein K6T36_16740 [Halobaculum roseum]
MSSSPVNRAITDEFDVRLVGVADDVESTDGGLFDDEEPATATVLFFEVENVGDEPVEWWYDEHDVLDEERYQYATDDSMGVGIGGSQAVDWLPPHWYAKIEIRPGARARCVTAIAEFPSDATIDRVYYGYDDIEYELAVDRGELGSPPV